MVRLVRPDGDRRGRDRSDSDSCSDTDSDDGGRNARRKRSMEEYLLVYRLAQEGGGSVEWVVHRAQPPRPDFNYFHGAFCGGGGGGRGRGGGGRGDGTFAVVVSLEEAAEGSAFCVQGKYE